MASHIIEVR